MDMRGLWVREDYGYERIMDTEYMYMVYYLEPDRTQNICIWSIIDEVSSGF